MPYFKLEDRLRGASVPYTHIGIVKQNGPNGEQWRIYAHGFNAEYPWLEFRFLNLGSRSRENSPYIYGWTVV